MRVCRYADAGSVEIGLFDDTRVVALGVLAKTLGLHAPQPSADPLAYLPPSGPLAEAALELDHRYQALTPSERAEIARPLQAVRLLVPVAQPKKVILLAGNYAEHIKEGGGQAVERDRTFPYFFLKPPSTTLTNPGDPVCIPAVSPDHVDWEVELGVVVGRRCRDVDEADALECVAGYTICNDISDRKYQINLGRQPREKDKFFDWQHGKWHDTFLPMGPCVRSAATLPDPQGLTLKLSVNGQLMQNETTAKMVFPVAALIAILSRSVTLEPGDVISTGTPSGVGFARKPPVFLKKGDVLEAEITGIGVLRNPVVGPD
jgi:2-keto-4-pentenoate hydratase/2-oxohepta-3-ene-1,7-dioic acid hydratase in catechol pathway